MTCARAEELLSDDLEGRLDGALAAELAAHLAGCAECRALRAALADVTLLLRAPALEPGADLAERVARASWAAGRAPIVRARALARLGQRRPRPGRAGSPRCRSRCRRWPRASALVLTAGLVMAASAAPGAPARPRIAQRLTDAAVYLLERKDRLVEDFRLLRVVVATAFEGRLDRVNDRVDDYRRLLEQPPEGTGRSADRSGAATPEQTHVRSAEDI